MDSVRRTNAPLYIAIVVGVALGACGGELRLRNVFACQANGYGSDRFLAYCEVGHYGDYDHGAFWYALEPTVRPYIRSAQVLFMGNSRMQWAFSSANTANWFTSAQTSYYLLGFGYFETYIFEGQVLRKFAPQPSAKAYVINLDGFFLPSASEPAQLVMNGGDALRRYQDKQFRQLVHKAVCTRLTALCGHRYAFFRSRVTGQWFRSGGAFSEAAISENAATDDAVVAQQAETGLEFLSHLPVSRDCVIFTIVPTVNTKYATAAAIAARLHSPFIAPQLDELRTFDGSHLDAASAERWSQAFLSAAGPRIQQCLRQPALAEAPPPPMVDVVARGAAQITSEASAKK